LFERRLGAARGYPREPGALRHAGDLTQRANTLMIMSAVASDRAEIDVARA
jgi:hypothetical protein